MLYLSSDLVLIDTPLPYRKLPLYRISAGEILNTPFGYTPLFDLLPIQEAVNSLYSTILTNQHAFGVQNVYVPKGADINVRNIGGALNIFEGNAQAGKPEALNLTQTPAEIFNFLKILEGSMETVSGINSVARGNPEASLRSGTALALVQSTALQFISGLQMNYIQLIEDVGTGLITVLKDYASTPRIAVIAGKTNQAYVEHEFTGEDLSSVNRVIVEVGNPLSRTTSGKTQIAESLIQYGIIKTPEQYFTVLNTGRLDALTDDTQNELLLIKSENEKMAEGISVKSLAIDQHLMHIKNHRSVLSDPDLRNDDNLTGIILGHINEHIEYLKSVDPMLLQMIGETPIQPPEPPMAPGGAEVPPSGIQEAAPVGDPAAEGVELPRPAPPFEDAPVTPQQQFERLTG
jgi:hypothetical protein